MIFEAIWKINKLNAANIISIGKSFTKNAINKSASAETSVKLSNKNDVAVTVNVKSKSAKK